MDKKNIALDIYIVQRIYNIMTFYKKIKFNLFIR